MNNIKEILRANRLLETYGVLLTPSQKEIMEDYYAYNLSFAEIAEQRKISRSAVADSLKKTLEKLEELETNLHLLMEKEKLEKSIVEIEKINKDEKIKAILNEMKKEV
ncbi:hypothetical protein SDC9_95233 [bioreactor metagenome]|uniref:Uncharacterized protein n=1 Tax=bioreactor metagenome TaxID=1076179 RepID=A0A645A728_9ZZZZ|nr:sigma factor-like helix-turn-helix DNA-binding protein [Erysipelotrichaceae bacterium]